MNKEKDKEESRRRRKRRTHLHVSDLQHEESKAVKVKAQQKFNLIRFGFEMNKFLSFETFTLGLFWDFRNYFSHHPYSYR